MRGLQQHISDASKRHGEVVESVVTAPSGGEAETVSQNKERFFLILANQGDTAVHYTFGKAVTTNDQRLATGERVVFENFVPTNAIRMLSESSDNDVYIAEG